VVGLVGVALMGIGLYWPELLMNLFVAGHAAGH
jgi:hypothetical protein